jgi:hypothetical protein
MISAAARTGHISPEFIVSPDRWWDIVSLRMSRFWNSNVIETVEASKSKCSSDDISLLFLLKKRKFLTHKIFVLHSPWMSEYSQERMHQKKANVCSHAIAVSRWEFATGRNFAIRWSSL